jgi:hypothetical protein
MFKVLIACFSKWDTSVELPYILKRAGCIVDVYCYADSWFLSNSYYDNWIESNLDKDSYMLDLIELVKSSNYQLVILADDPLIKYINEADLDEETFKKILPIIKPENRYMLSSKIGLSLFCEKHNILAPAFVNYNNIDDQIKIKTKLTFPVVVKRDFSSAGADMFISNSYDELILKLNNTIGSNKVMIQDLIEGNEIHVEALFYKGYLLSYQNSDTIERATDQFSYRTRKQYYRNADLAPLLIYLGDTLGLNGFANISYMHRGNDYFLFEVDPRPNSWVAYSRFISDNDFSNGIKRIINGEYKMGYIDAPQKKEFIEVALFYKDLRRALWKKDLKGIGRWIFNVKGYWRFLPFYDLKLSKRIFSEIWKEIFAPKWKKIFNYK